MISRLLASHMLHVRESGAPSSLGERIWTPGMVSPVKAAVVHLQLAVVGPLPAAIVCSLSTSAPNCTSSIKR